MGLAPQDTPYQIFHVTSIEEAPDPPVPEEVDLTNLPWMPLHVDKLLSSTFGMTVSLSGFGAAVFLWSYAWHQPRASLPNDERILARVCGLRVTDQECQDIKDEALSKFFPCSDGRLYHPYMSEMAIDAWERHCRRKEHGKRGAEKRWHSKDHSPTNDKTNATIQHNTTQLSNEPKGSLSGQKPRRRPKAPVDEIIGNLNERAGTGFSPNTKSTINAINARWGETQNLKRYKLVIDYLCFTWLPDPDMAGYVRPSTIFRESKFEGYAEAAIRWAEKTKYVQEEDDE